MRMFHRDFVAVGEKEPMIISDRNFLIPTNEQIKAPHWIEMCLQSLGIIFPFLSPVIF